MCHVGQTLPLKNMNTIEKPGTCSTSEELLPPQEKWFRAQGHWSKEKKKIKKTPAVSRRNWGRGWDDREQIQNYSIIGWAGKSRKTSRLPAKSWKHQKQMVGSIQEDLTTAWQVYQNDTIFLSPGSRLQNTPVLTFRPGPIMKQFLIVSGLFVEESEEWLSLGTALPPAGQRPGTVPEERKAAAIWNSWVCFQHFSVEMRGCRAPQRSLASPALR